LGSEPVPLDSVATVAALRKRVSAWREAGETVALVPTMGALHDAHLTLIAEAQARCDRTVVSIFVNPKQFGPGEDFTRYPRPIETDVAALRAANVDLLYAPTVEEMYPPGDNTTVSVRGPLTAGLCAAARPGHFDGVATVCTRLFLQCLPDIAMFGEKDYQQLLMIRRMVADLAIPVEIVAVETVREEGGLALSSRNAYLSAEDRKKAARINLILADVAAAVADGGDIATEIGRGLAALAKAGIDDVDYLEIRDAETLEPVTTLVRPARVFVAVRLNGTRLIDNRPVETFATRTVPLRSVTRKAS